MSVFCLYRKNFVPSLLLSRNYGISLAEQFSNPKASFIKWRNAATYTRQNKVATCTDNASVTRAA